MTAKQDVILSGEPSHQVVPGFSFGDMQRMATSIAKSGLFGVKDADQALSLMMIAQADGIHPATAARDYSIIQGQAAKKAEAILRDFQRSGGVVVWHERTDTVCSATFKHPSSSPLKVDWTIERAQKAGLAGKDNWKKYARAMLHARCVSEGCRATAPGSTGGHYTPEEIMDLDTTEQPQSIGASVSDVATAPSDAEVEATINSMDVTTLSVLKERFAAAWGSTKNAPTLAKYKAVYESMKAAIDEARSRDVAESNP